MSFTSKQVREWLVLAANQQGSQKALAKEIGVSQAFLSDVIRGRREPSGKPLEWLGVAREVRYVRHTRKSKKNEAT